MKSLIPSIKILDAGSAPLVTALCDEIKVAEIINQLVTWDGKIPCGDCQGIYMLVIQQNRRIYDCNGCHQGDRAKQRSQSSCWSNKKPALHKKGYNKQILWRPGCHSASAA